MTKTLTAMQYALMNLIAHHEMNTTNGATPTETTDVNTWLWADEFAKELGFTGKQVGGLITTLTEAGLLGVNKVKKVRGQPDESTVWFTDAGFAAWQAAYQAAQPAKEEEAPKASPKKKAAKVKTAKVVKAKEEKAEPTTLDLLASREGSHKRAAAIVLLENAGDGMTLGELAKLVYGKEELTGHIAMVLKGIFHAIAVHKLPLKLVREDGKVTLFSLEEKAPKAKRTKKAA